MVSNIVHVLINGEASLKKHYEHCEFNFLALGLRSDIRTKLQVVTAQTTKEFRIAIWNFKIYMCKFKINTDIMFQIEVASINR